VVRKVTVRNTGTAPATLRIGERTGTGPGTGTPGTTWRGLPDLPVVVMDNAVESYRGKIYSVFGSSDGYKPIAGLYVYNPSARAWTRGASAPGPRRAVAHGFIGGRLYTVGGWGPGEVVSRAMQVYDPAQNTWTKGPSMPKGRFGAASSVLDGRLYVVGGCTNAECSNSVYVFDPGSGKWSRAADYPQSIGWASCGAINGKLYCAGGAGPDYVETGAAHVYDPVSNSWQSIADMPVGLAAGAYAAANGRLLVSGGTRRVGANSVVTPESYAYDPGTNSWSALPDASTAAYRGGGALGLYRVGGSTDIGFPAPAATAELLPGYDQTELDLSWLSETPHRLTLRPGQRASFTVTLNAGKIGRPGDWTASLILRGDTPYWLPPIPVSLHIAEGASS
jgi:N-acetylneuraminic acid mutarotase